MALTPALKTFVEQKISTLDKFISHPDGGIQVMPTGRQAWVEIGLTTKGQKSGDIYRAEVQISVPHIEKGVRVEARHIDLYTAIESAKDLMKMELQKTKDKKISLSRRGARILKDTLRFFTGSSSQ